MASTANHMPSAYMKFTNPIPQDTNIEVSSFAFAPTNRFIE